VRASVALGLGLLALAAGCPRTNASRAPHDDGDTAAIGSVDGSGRSSASAVAPTIDGSRMLGLLGALADDALGGRYTLASQDIDRAAEMLATAYREAGIAPVGEHHRVTYPVITGVRERVPTSLAIGGPARGGQAGAPVEVPRTAVVARSASGSGTASGEVVFVGYGVRSKPGPDGTSVYDDLAGIDLRGKIALCLDELPATPELASMFNVLRAKAEAFETKVAGLRAKKDAKGMARAHVALRKDIARTFAPWMRGRSLPRAFTAAPADPFATVDVRGIVDALTEASEALPGPQFDSRSARIRVKIDRLAEAGATGVIVVQGPRTYVGDEARQKAVLPDLAKSRPGIEPMKIPVVQMSWREADARFRVGGRNLSTLQAAIDRKLVPQSATLPGTTATITVALEPTTVQVPNVLAQIPGSDKKDEIVVIGAHFDHIGRDGNGQCHTAPGDAEKDGICNGADDNASGTAMVVEAARALAAAGVKPRRTLVFAHFSGEEIGLHGSKALAESPPKVGPFARGKVVAMVNLDMVGRLDDRGLAIGGVGSSPAWMPLLDEIGPHGLPVLYDRAITTRSDHASFYRKQVPVLFFFTHLHDDYHRPADETPAINGEGMTKIAALVVDLLAKLGDGREVPFAEPKHPSEGLVGALPGSNPATVEKRVGLAATKDAAATGI